jgi:ABC-type polysaccharide/polyol phosphate transport system ATPase subunit
MLKILGGIYTPSTGRVTVHGSLSPFIELGVGFNPELTARDNVFLNGAILGLSRKEVAERYEDIVEFAELQEFMDQRLKNYSSGMQVRLAFSIAIQAQSDILLIDEVLAVGDANFQAKCYNVFRQMKREGRTIVFVSHDMNAIKDFCDRALLIHDGEVAGMGSPDRIINKYNQLNLVQRDEAASQEYALDTSNRWGTGTATVKSVMTMRGEERSKTFEPGQEITVEVEVEFRSEVDQPVIGLVIKNAEGLRVMATNTRLKRITTKSYGAKDKTSIVLRVKNIFADGRYTISPFISDLSGHIFHDWVEDGGWFDVTGNRATDGIVMPDHRLTLRRD